MIPLQGNSSHLSKSHQLFITAYLISHFIYNYPTESGFANIVRKSFSEYHYTYQHISYFPLFLMVHTSPPWVTSSKLYPWRKLLHSWSLLKKRDLGYFNVTSPIYTHLHFPDTLLHLPWLEQGWKPYPRAKITGIGFWDSYSVVHLCSTMATTARPLRSCSKF